MGPAAAVKWGTEGLGTRAPGPPTSRRGILTLLARESPGGPRQYVEMGRFIDVGRRLGSVRSPVVNAATIVLAH